MNTPPPLTPESDRKSIFHQAAMAGLAAPAIAVLVNVLTASMRHAETGQRAPSLIVGIVAMLLIVTGFVLGIVALCGISRHGKKGLLGRGIAALIINGVLIGFFIIGLAGGVKRAAERRQAWSEVSSAARSLREGVQNNFDPETGLTNDLSDELGEFQTRIAAASKNVKGDDALIMQATAAFAARMKAHVKKFNAIAEELTEAEVSNIGRMSEQSEIEARRKLVQRFLVANKQFLELSSSQADLMEKELRAKGLGPAKVEKFVVGFRNSQAPMLPKLKAIRGCDEKMGQALLEILDLAEANWGKFGFDEDQGTTVFTEDALIESFNMQIEVIQQAAKDQMRLQGELFELQRKLAAAQE